MAKSVSMRRRQARLRRHVRVRRRVTGQPERPRLAVFRSLKHVYAQIIDDTTGRTLVAASTRDPQLADALAGADKTKQAGEVGRSLAERAQAAGIETVVFDRGGFRYHGRVRALAEAAREAGLTF